MRYSQQEFLVMGEFDFSDIKSLQIICYDNSYAELLKQIFADDPISNRITTYGNVFERENRSITMFSDEETTCFSTDFRDEYYFSIKGENLDKVQFDLSECEVVYDKKDELRVKGRIAWSKTDIKFDIIFVDPKARTKEWLVYQNF